MEVTQKTVGKVIGFLAMWAVWIYGFMALKDMSLWTVGGIVAAFLLGLTALTVVFVSIVMALDIDLSG